MLTLLCGLALAGTLTVDADRALSVSLNGVPVPFDARARRASVAGLAEGLYHVEVDTPEGARVGEAMVAVTGELPSALSARGGVLDRLLSARSTGGEGTLLLTVPPGWGPEPVIELNGARDPSAARGGRLLPAGAHALSVKVGGESRFSGYVDVLPGRSTRCVVLSELHCELGPLARASEPAAQAPAPAAEPTPVSVVFVLKDGFDMSNVYVDGRKVLEFRTNDKEKAITLSSGVHTVEIRSFTEFDTWARGTLTVTPGEPIRVGFDEQSVEVYNRPGAWAPTR